MSHDHLIECRDCGMPVQDVRDCTCGNPHYAGVAKCGPCKEQAAYEQAERARNASY